MTHENSRREPMSTIIGTLSGFNRNDAIKGHRISGCRGLHRRHHGVHVR
jgi:hypothetical protein